MKRILISCLLCCFLSCSEDKKDFDVELNGSWTLTNVSCFCGFPDPPEFNLTEITFDETVNEIIVVNEGSQVYFRENGVYSYADSVDRITLEDGRAYFFEINEDILRLVFIDEPNIADDEISYSFIRSDSL